MISSSIIFAIGGAYLGVLFLLAYIGDRQAEKGALGILGSPAVYTLSLAVYCTSWTFYGAVGSAARNGLEFLTIYIGPTLVMMGWWFVLRKLVRVSKAQKITSIADFISARYGKSASLSAIITLIALVGITPYIALQLKAVAASFDAFTSPDSWSPVSGVEAGSIMADTGLWVAFLMATFVILFGTRNLGADERHPGVVVAIAVESIVKLLSLGAIAAFVVYGLHDGLQDMFARSSWNEGVQRLYTFNEGFEYRWIALTFLSAAAMICLPRQFQVAVVENSDERHLATASWLFPLYLLLVSLFVLPIAISGLTQLPETANPDLFVLSLPLAAGQNGLAILAFIGGLSAATSMVIVASIALSIMISNHLVTPILLRLPYFSGPNAGDMRWTLLLVRRLSIIAILTLGFIYYRVTSAANPLASIGLISFVGVAQFLPALIGGIYWSGGTRVGATVGLLVGFAMWLYTLLLPSLAGAGWAFGDIVANGPFGIEMLRPAMLFGITGWDPLVHGLFWSLSFNLALYVLVSVISRQSPLEQLQSVLFTDPDNERRGDVEGVLQRSAATDDLFQLTKRILGPDKAEVIFRDYAKAKGDTNIPASNDARLIAHVERQLASNVGAASARSLVSRIVEGETISLESVITLIDEKEEVVRYSQELERQRVELEDTAAKLKSANEQLTRMDRMKDDFLSQVSHELRTPMTSIRSFSDILSDGGPTDPAQHNRYMRIIQAESVRLTRLLDDILELGRFEAGAATLSIQSMDAVASARHAMDTMHGLAEAEGVEVIDRLGSGAPMVDVDEDRMTQVFVNLLSNAIKFNTSESPKVWVEIGPANDTGYLEIHIRDNGPGIPADQREAVFSKFSRGWSESTQQKSGSGLGLPICRQIMDSMGGDLTLMPDSSGGCTFVIRLVRSASMASQATAE